ncbi:hypothetical protein BDK92_5777 [Micromonospora pisi]|uniref:Uncharacterized protein n=1 Tax=Micromonospora pisi TaxID=589240 RepID=A0A495JSP5_9ACTN|nr:hypothetical protein [Micromonospora pisi]RKR91382.1 hypothetical protein BDK92_5777 [Micromonospora pisi]
MTGRPFPLNVGDIVHAEADDYHRGGNAPGHQDAMDDLHLRITHLPMDAGANDTEWITVRGIEKPMGKPELPEAEYVIRRRVLLDREPATPRGPVW